MVTTKTVKAKAYKDKVHVSDYSGGSFVWVDTTEKGATDAPERRPFTSVCLSPKEARRLAKYLKRAARRLEETS